MTIIRRGQTMTGAIIVLLTLSCVLGSAAFAQGPKPPAPSLKNFTSVEQWQLDVTWTAKDSFDDDRWTAKLEMTGTARFILKQRNKSVAGGYWGVESVQSANLSYTGSATYKSRNEHLDYKAKGGPVMMGAASLVVGAATPGYQLGVTIAFPIKLTDAQGTHDSLLTLLVGNPYASGPASTCTGPLPASGDTIQGSMVVPFDIPPFVGSSPRNTKVGITYVLRPYVELAPLVPQRNK